MKIILEFDTVIEHDMYIQTKAKEYIKEFGEQIIVNPEEEINNHVSQPDTTIETYTRRRYWTDLELQFLRDHYVEKNVRWIAKALRLKDTDVQQKLYQLYK